MHLLMIYEIHKRNIILDFIVSFHGLRPFFLLNEMYYQNIYLTE